MEVRSARSPGSSIWATTTTFMSGSPRARSSRLSIRMPDLPSATVSRSPLSGRSISTAKGIGSMSKSGGSLVRERRTTMDLGNEGKRRLIAAVALAVIDNAEELTALDRAIGDGDHGLNMKRGFEAVLADLDGLAEKSLPELCKGIGTHLVMTIGGASGPLYGTLFLALGKSLPPSPDLPAAARAFAAAVAAVKARGKSDVGEKTMLDVLMPVAKSLEAAAAGEASGDLPAQLRAAAD